MWLNLTWVQQDSTTSISNKKVTDKTEIAELFNNFFVMVGKNVKNKIPKPNETFEKYMSRDLAKII